MTGLKVENLFAVVALTVSAGFSVAWIGGWLIEGGDWPLHASLLVAGLAITGGLISLTWRRRRREDRAVERYLEALCQLDPQTVSPDENGAQPSSPTTGKHEGTVAEQVGEKVLQLCRRIQDSEQARRALEVRCNRATAQAAQIKHFLLELAEPILAIDNYDELVLANHSAEKLFNIDGEATETRVLSRLVHCEKLVQMLTSTRQRKTISNRTDEIEITDAEGLPRWYRATALKLGVAGEDVPEGTVADGAVVVLRDIGNQKALQKRNAEFVSAVSHEMKTPLAGIKAYVELLADGDAEDEKTQEEFFNVINGQADRLQRLIDNMLNLARIEAGVVNVSKQSRSLNEVLEEALQVVQPSAEAKRIQLVSEISPLYLGVLADRDMLLQATINLLSNAIKYTESGGKVTLRSQSDGDQVRFEVQDSGVGLSEEDCRKVFEKFYRVKKNKQMAAGTGLGLPLAKHIVEDVHGGTLRVESVLGQGSTFTAAIPCAGRAVG